MTCGIEGLGDVRWQGRGGQLGEMAGCRMKKKASRCETEVVDENDHARLSVTAAAAVAAAAAAVAAAGGGNGSAQ